MKKHWKQYGKVCVAGVVLVLAGLCYAFAGRTDGMIQLDEEKHPLVLETLEQIADEDNEAGIGVESSSPVSSTEETSVPNICYVHVCGEVKYPGVYALPKGSRIFEAVEAAGGLTPEASDTGLNQAQKIEDGMQLVIPDKEEASQMEKVREEMALGLVNLNTATKEQLMTLPGIGESRAEAILRYREESGGFQSIDEIMQVSGIKEAAYRKIKDRITI